MDPYLPPTATEPASPQSSTSSRLSFYTFHQVKKLYHRSCNLNCLAGLMMIGLVIILLATTSFAAETSEDRALNLLIPGLLGVFYLLAFIGLFQRTSWGRILCIISCFLALFSVFAGNILGFIFGLAGLFACFGSPKLFGQDRYLHKELKAEFKARKMEIKTQRKASKGRPA